MHYKRRVNTILRCYNVSERNFFNKSSIVLFKGIRVKPKLSYIHPDIKDGGRLLKHNFQDGGCLCINSRSSYLIIYIYR